VGAVAPEPDACPRCGAGVARGQEYCVECGTRLPSQHGVVPALGDAWRSRFRWYPGDWLWFALVLLVVAGASAAVAIAATGDQSSGVNVVVATSDRPVPAKPSPRQATSTPTPAERRQTTTAPARKPGTLVQWPFGRTAYTVVLSSFPSAAGERTASQLARKASRAGLLDVGFLDSSKITSLHPGYFVVFSGVYESADDAQSALQQAVKKGFKKAYTRQIVS
jgi:cell division septation protein DedD